MIISMHNKVRAYKGNPSVTGGLNYYHSQCTYVIFFQSFEKMVARDSLPSEGQLN